MIVDQLFYELLLQEFTTIFTVVINAIRRKVDHQSLVIQIYVVIHL